MPSIDLKTSGLMLAAGAGFLAGELAKKAGAVRPVVIAVTGVVFTATIQAVEWVADKGIRPTR